MPCSRCAFCVRFSNYTEAPSGVILAAFPGMKRCFLLLLLLRVASSLAQEEDTLWLYRPSAEERIAWMRLVDSAAHAQQEFRAPTDPATKALYEQLRLHPVIPHASLYRLMHPYGLLPPIYVIDNTTLQLGVRIRLTNGQAWLWSPYPNGYQDARTLSLPLP